MPIPKAELHIHIEGTLEPELAFALAARNGIALPFDDVAALREAYNFSDLQSFLDLYYASMVVLRTPEVFEDLAVAYLERAAAQGVRHAEIFFDPQAHAARGVGLDVVMEGLTRATDASAERFGITTELILCFLRDLPADEAQATLEAAVPYRDKLIAVGLDSAEVGHPPVKFMEVYAAARALGLRCVAHAGEEGPPSYIWEALDLLHVERIDHGVRCLEDERLVGRLRDDRIPLTVCPFSNVRLRVVDRLEDHPLARMMQAGLLVTVNSDDPSYFGGYVGDNLDGVTAALGLTQDDVRTLARNSIIAAFLGEERRAELLAEVEAYVF
jgi:adenosine deaminase